MSDTSEIEAEPAGDRRRRRQPIGAEVRSDGVHFRVWAPASPTAAIELYPAGQSAREPTRVPLTAEPGGYFSGLANGVRAGAQYRIRLESGSFPDPASRFQPDGPHGASEVIDPGFAWTDEKWAGRPASERVIYELHLGTFTPEGTWRAAQRQLAELARIGMTVVEIMPVADFPGRFGWGYDGVNFFAPSRLYGRPEEARAFINHAHELGLMVLLDVVYNHLGPDGNYLPQFSPDYLTSRYECEWGEPLNFDGENAGPVREYFVSNAAYWMDEFHFDGLRLDATQQIFDASRPHIIAEIVQAARAAGQHGDCYLVGENEPQHASLLRDVAVGGCGLDAVWNDDFHHTAAVAASGRIEAYYRDYRGGAQELVSAAKHGFLYQGQRSGWQGKRRGTPAFDLTPANFIAYLQNHDQIANSLRGLRLDRCTTPAQLRALTAVLLLGRQTPLIFQGQEFAASTPFLYFADHKSELAVKVAEGRADFLSQFPSVALEECRHLLAPPHDPETFQRSKLNLAERQTHAGIYRLHEDLLRLRREDPAICHAVRFDGAVLGPDAFVLRYFGREPLQDRILVVNLGADLHYNPAPEPLLAPVEGYGWTTLWSSESPRYDGDGSPPLETTANWLIRGNRAILMAPHQPDEPPPARLGEKD